MAVTEHVHVQECWQGNGTVPGFVEVYHGIPLGGCTREAGQGLVDILLELLHQEENRHHGELMMVGSHHLGEGGKLLGTYVGNPGPNPWTRPQPCPWPLEHPLPALLVLNVTPFSWAMI